MATYASADWHGCYWIWKKIKEILKPNDTLYFLGDAADRGPDGWQIIKELLNDSRIIYLKGNHEDLLIKAIGNITTNDIQYDHFHWNNNMELWFYNGGEKTYNTIIKDTTIFPEEKIDIIHSLKNLPFCAVYHNMKQQDIILSHSGYDDENGDEEKYIWDRTHFMLYDDWYGMSNEIIVHGHTPIELMIKEQLRNVKWLSEKHKREGVINDHLVKPQPWKGEGAYWYAKNHKCNIDTGAVWDNTSTLLNLDTWEEIIINKC